MDDNQLEEWKYMMLFYKFALDGVSTKLKILNEEFQFIHDYNPIEHIKTRLKSLASIREKLGRKGHEATIENAKAYIRDIAGVRVICSFSTDIYKIYRAISGQSDIRIVEVKDYVTNPKENGYQSVHMIVEVPVYLTDRTEYTKVEIQIRTSAMDFWASLEHKIYYKFNSDVPDHIRLQLKESADLIASLDRRMLQLGEEVQSYRPDAPARAEAPLAEAESGEGIERIFAMGGSGEQSVRR
ncbi:GTP pyrophosphokinase [Paenibacillus beijingensis]|uniref:GTP pyrophosphokinase n=1 Tax=Paenibacillus beijingensis TaxID=1126833 RepID=UPI000A9924E8